MDERQLDSDVLKSVSHDTHSGMLIVRFNSGARYLYESVPRNLYEDLLKAESAGKFFNQHISRKFKSRKIS